MQFLNALPLHILVLLGLALLGLCNYLKTLHALSGKIKMFSNYRNALAEFHNNAKEGKDIPTELSDYLLENAVKITLDSVVRMTTYEPILGISTGIVNTINNIVSGECHEFTRTCKNVDNMLTNSIGAFKDIKQKILSKIINPISPIHFLKNGVSIILNIIPIVNLTPRKIKDFLSNLFVFIGIVNTILSLYLKKSFLLSIFGFFVN